MSQPKLFVVAGPNGSGKSTLSQGLVTPGTFVFDGDREMLQLQKKFPDIDSGNLFDAVNGPIFQEFKDKAMNSRSDFGFETNFRVAAVMDTVGQFREAGYQTHLIFLGLQSIQLSMDRVAHRTENGGHFVDEINIKANYERGMENLLRYYKDFDQVILLQGDSAYRLASLLKIEKGVIVEQAESLPIWADQIPFEIQRELLSGQALRQQHNGQEHKRDQGLSSGMHM